jgi:hypothetical protein
MLIIEQLSDDVPAGLYSLSDRLPVYVLTNSVIRGCSKR